MNTENSLKVIGWISILGFLFASYSSYVNFALGQCRNGLCPSVYTTLAFVVIFVFSLNGLKNNK